MDIMDFSSGIFAFFINDFSFPESKIGDFKLFYDSVSGDFISKNDPELRYAKEGVLSEPHFLIFKEVVFQDEDGEFVTEVEPYKFS